MFTGDGGVNLTPPPFKIISNFRVFCTQTYGKCRFWANFVPTWEYKTSCDLATDGPIFANLKEKSHEKACCDLRQSRGSRRFRTGGGGQIDPPPPVKIGLMLIQPAFNKSLLTRYYTHNISHDYSSESPNYA